MPGRLLIQLNVRGGPLDIVMQISSSQLWLSVQPTLTVGDNLTAMIDNVRTISEVLQRYFDGWHFADASLLESAFHPNAHLYANIGDRLDDDDMKKVLESVRLRESPSARGEIRHDAILLIDVVNNQTAVAKVQLSIGDKLFTDYLSLIRVDNRWQIISKIFHISPL